MKQLVNYDQARDDVETHGYKVHRPYRTKGDIPKQPRMDSRGDDLDTGVLDENG